ncbi:MAG: 2-amino-4-hydroxy-6-hydroxymethyldihydropteridine diphosphokinase [bacterium]|nr:MAG: 2-amino-4-hydroxy-6-hydroxymethyldihydropteridine diphosphokinase [bacterium]
MPAWTAYIGLGTNLGDRVKALETAMERLGALEGCRVKDVSSLYETSPVGLEGGPFLNLVAVMETNLEPGELLERLLAVESAMGRIRLPGTIRSRVIDLDLLVHGDHIVEEKGLVLPHPRMLARRFVMEPLAELAPEMRITPGGKTACEVAKELREKHPEQEVVKLGKLEEGRV